MITFDTNPLTPSARRGRELDRIADVDLQLLWAVAARRGLRMALPATVLDELASRYRRAVADQIAVFADPASTVENRTAARRLLLLLVPDSWSGRADFARGDDSKRPQLDSVERRFREMWTFEMFAVLPKPPGADEEGNRREIERIPPAYTGRDGAAKGSRDTAIWLTVLEAGRHRLPGNLYFVTNDQGFSDPLRPELVAESAMLSLYHFTTLDQLMDELSEPASLPEPIDDLIQNEPVVSRIRAALTSGSIGVQLSDWYLGAQSGLSREDVLKTFPRVPDDATARRVGKTTLVTFRRIWHVDRSYLGWALGKPLAWEIAFTASITLTVAYESGHLVRVGTPLVMGIRGDADPMP